MIGRRRRVDRHDLCDDSPTVVALLARPSPHDVLYLISGFASTTGSATFTRTPVTDLSGVAQSVVTATDVHGDNSATWNPLIQVSVPSGAVAGAYSATITHSVS